MGRLLFMILIIVIISSGVAARGRTQEPEGTFDKPFKARSGEQVRFSITSNPPEVAIYEWDFGDGAARKTGAAVDHTYQKSGNYTVLLRMIENNIAREAGRWQFVVP